MLADDLEHTGRVGTGIVEPDKAEVVGGENLQVFENLLVGGGNLAGTPVRVLSHAIARVSHGHRLS